MELLGRGPSDFEGYIAEILWLRLKASVTALPCPVLLFLLPLSYVLLPFAVFHLPSSFFLVHYPGPCVALGMVDTGCSALCAKKEGRSGGGGRALWRDASRAVVLFTRR